MKMQRQQPKSQTNKSKKQNKEWEKQRARLAEAYARSDALFQQVDRDVQPQLSPHFR